MSRLAETSHELMDICRAIHPAIVSVGGLQPALDSLARRCPVPVDVAVVMMVVVLAVLWLASSLGRPPAEAS